MSKVSKDYLIYTFAIMLVCWGTCMIFSFNGMTINDNYVLYIPYLIGGWSPTIASYIVLKKNKQISSFKEWIKSIFDFKHKVTSYLLVICFSALFILPQCLIAGYHNGQPFWAIALLIPVMLILGGLEETGWRYILQPELEKRYSYVIATIIVALIWWLWHCPLFLIEGLSKGNNYLAFGIKVFGLSFALACIRKCTNSIWLSMLFHCIINSLLAIYLINESILSNIVTSVLLIVISLVLLKIDKKKKLFG